jgi:hypothetical protein
LLPLSIIHALPLGMNAKELRDGFSLPQSVVTHNFFMFSAEHEELLSQGQRAPGAFCWHRRAE